MVIRTGTVGNDFHFGTKGPDRITDGFGDNYAKTFAGHDIISFNEGDDTVFAGRGWDSN